MMRTLVARGMLAGLIAGVLATAFAYFLAEPSIESAIALEQEHTAHQASSGHSHHGEPVVSRGIQSTIGLFTGLAGYAVAAGGLFALVFAVLHGRISTLRPRSTSVVLAAACYVVVVLVPFLKYPANPPAVGSAQTIDSRTALYFGLLALSLVVACLAVYSGWRVARQRGAWQGGLLGCACYLVVTAVAAAVMPVVDEVAATFPASTLWTFRVSSLGTNLVLWVALGIAFGTLAEHALSSRNPHRRVRSPVRAM